MTKTKTRDDFDWFYLDGFAWTDLIDFFQLPHYTNDCDGTDARKQRTVEMRTVKLPWGEDPKDVDDHDILVIWPAKTKRPTNREVVAAIREREE